MGGKERKNHYIQWRLLSLSNGQNPGNADRMGISGGVLCPLTLKWL